MLTAFILFALSLTFMSVSAQDGYSSMPIACNQAGQFAFTFDEGPAFYTGELLNTLQKYEIKAAFHVTTDYFSNPVVTAYLRRAVTDGHIVGLVIKPDMLKQPDQLRDTLTALSQRVQQAAGGYRPTFVRFPLLKEGIPDAIYQLVTKEMGYTATGFNLDAQDYLKQSGGNDSVFWQFKQAVDMIVPPAKGAFISIQRDIYQPSVAQTDRIIKYVMDKGYTVVRLDECIGKPGAGNSNSGGGASGNANGRAANNNTNSLLPSMIALLLSVMLGLLASMI